MRLWGWLNAGGRRSSGSLRAPDAVVELADLADASNLGARLEELRGRNVLLVAREQLCAALALIELDGVAQRMVLCPPDLPRQHLPGVITNAGVDACVHDPATPEAEEFGIPRCITMQAALGSPAVERRASHETEWVLLTSGTTGAPKLVLHTFASLTSAMSRAALAPAPCVWSTFYDIRRYGGLQIFLRALRDGSMLLSSAAESTADFLARAGAMGVTHISGTPSHWRRALMSGAAAQIAPRYVRLSGEIADQAILDSLHVAYPAARIAHAFASTEAGVAFEVEDSRAGFPATVIAQPRSEVEMEISEGTLRIRSPGNALRYLGQNAPALKDPDGFVTTGDRLELRDGRYYFMGRSGGVINVGGMKVHPEEVEAVINSHPGVRTSLVKARRSPITGAIVEAEVVLAGTEWEREPPGRPSDEELIKDILETCRRTLAPHKVPATIRIVPALPMSASGKLVRPGA
jgi:acyl-coenzyme A synthetase/AMP-(fatty) acid ligase